MWCALDFGLLIIAGYALAAGFVRRASRVETIALSLCIGPGAVAFCLLLFSMLGLKPNRPEILCLGAFFAAAAIGLRKMRPRIPDPDAIAGRIPSWWIIACGCAIGYGFFSVAIDAFQYPVIEWDAFAIWQLKANVLCLFPLRPMPDYFTNLSLSYSHLRYPLMVPMLSAQLQAMDGRISSAGKMIGLIFFPGMCAAVFAAVKRLNGAFAALTATALLACAEPVCRYGGSGTAELPLTAFYACSILCILRWRENGDHGFLVLSAILSGWMAWTKNEGLALALINCIVIAFSGLKASPPKSLSAGAAHLAIFVLIYLPWIVFSWGLPRTDEDYAGRLMSLAIFTQAHRLGEVLMGIGRGLIDWEYWGIFWLLAAAIGIAERRRLKNQTAVVGVLLMLHILTFIPAYMVTTWKLEELFAVSVDRLLMHAAPAGAILIGALWPVWAGGTPRQV